MTNVSQRKQQPSMLGRDDNMSERLHVRAYALHTQTCETHMA